MPSKALKSLLTLSNIFKSLLNFVNFLANLNIFINSKFSKVLNKTFSLFSSSNLYDFLIEKVFCLHLSESHLILNQTIAKRLNPLPSSLPIKNHVSIHKTTSLATVLKLSIHRYPIVVCCHFFGETVKCDNFLLNR